MYNSAIRLASYILKFKYTYKDTMELGQGSRTHFGFYFGIWHLYIKLHSGMTQLLSSDNENELFQRQGIYPYCDFLNQ